MFKFGAVSITIVSTVPSSLNYVEPSPRVPIGLSALFYLMLFSVFWFSPRDPSRLLCGGWWGVFSQAEEVSYFLRWKKWWVVGEAYFLRRKKWRIFLGGRSGGWWVGRILSGGRKMSQLGFEPKRTKIMCNEVRNLDHCAIHPQILTFCAL